MAPHNKDEPIVQPTTATTAPEGTVILEPVEGGGIVEPVEGGEYKPPV
jgi:hypothetical protein